MNPILEEYLNKKVCYKCKKAQSSKRSECLVASCRGLLRLRKAYKKR